MGSLARLASLRSAVLADGGCIVGGLSGLPLDLEGVVVVGTSSLANNIGSLHQLSIILTQTFSLAQLYYESNLNFSVLALVDKPEHMGF